MDQRRGLDAPRGTRDLLPEDGHAWSRVEGIARDLSERFRPEVLAEAEVLYAAA